MIVLGFDTAMDACSAAVWAEGRVAARRHEIRAKGHAEALFPMLAEVCLQAGIEYGDVDRVAVTIGPGTFTGTRIGLAAARGLALSLDIPAIGLTTLEVIAAAGRNAAAFPRDGVDAIVPVIDARRGQVYLQILGPDLAARSEPLALNPAEVPDLLGKGCSVLVGSGAALVPDTPSRDLFRLPMTQDGEGGRPDAAVVVELAAARPLPQRRPDGGFAPPRPLYLRPPDAKLPVRR